MLELINVSFAVEGEAGVKEIVKDVSLTVEDGFVALTGPNGGGKSTLAKLIAGIYTPTSGKILLDGLDITEMSVTEISASSTSQMRRPLARARDEFIKSIVIIISDIRIWLI